MFRSGSLSVSEVGSVPHQFQGQHDQLGVAAGAREIVVHPDFLGPGRHSREDIPRMAMEAAARPEVRTFVHYYLNTAADIAPEVGYVRLAREVGYRSALRFQQGVTGSVFWDLEEEEKIDAPLLDLLRGTANRR